MGTGQYLDRQAGFIQPQAQRAGCLLVDHDREGGTKLPALFEQAIYLPVGCQRHHAVALRVSGNHIQRVRADAAGCPKYYDSLRFHQFGDLEPVMDQLANCSKHPVWMQEAVAQVDVIDWPSAVTPQAAHRARGPSGWSKKSLLPACGARTAAQITPCPC
ncbi:hypothetical protein NH8B_2564 [Pseudogulbenkiania sp. NH8B]|nr:hypothetical protein NH8B_2564 [Pseudogulbenkiania sp. NH8B]